MLVNGRDLIIHLSVKYNGDWKKIYDTIESKNVDDVVPLSTKEKCITILDEVYPNKIRQKCYKPPFALFYDGDINLLKSKNILSFVGARDPSEDATNAAVYLLKDYNGTIIMSGSMGLEDIVYSMVDKPIVVLPNSLDKSADFVHKVVSLGGLVISEYPSGVDKTTDTCLSRCRIIEAIADKTLAIEVKRNSNAIVRCNFACNYSNKVFVVPKQIWNKDYFNNQLIYEGAKIMLFKEDLQSE